MGEHLLVVEGSCYGSLNLFQALSSFQDPLSCGEVRQVLWSLASASPEQSSEGFRACPYS